ncbi:AMP-binding protein, partial [Rhodococcus sp. NCIMB 12038]|uniref:AMP-binding protein n=1 Tax=Rhodococcus sp. NCIMB 12038 TaxID=933800 RepID=UPI000B582F38
MALHTSALSDAAGERFPLSAAQRGIWFAQKVSKSVPINIAQFVEIDGELDADVFAEAVQATARELHSPYLRLVEVDGRPMQLVDTGAGYDGSVVDFCSEPDPAAAALEWMRADYSAPIDLVEDVLADTKLLRLSRNHYYWYSRMHHIAIDGYAGLAATARAAERYNAIIDGREPAPLSALGLEDIYEGELAYRNSERFASDRAYWLDHAKGLPAPLSLTGRTASAAPYDLVAACVLPVHLASQLDSAADAYRVSTAQIVVAALGSFLARMTNSGETVLSLPVTARTTAALKRSAGMVANVLPIRLAAGPATTIGELVDLARRELTGALRHQRYRYEDIRRDTGLGGDTSSTFGPVVNMMFFDSEIRLGDAVGRYHILRSGLLADLQVNLVRSGSNSPLTIEFHGNPHLFSQRDLAHHHRRFLAYLERFVTAAPHSPVGEIDLLDDADRALVPGRGPHAEPPVLLPDLLSTAAAIEPGATALVFGKSDMSYRELDERSNRLARHLIGLGVGPESRVALALGRSIDLWVAVWAVAKSGAAFVPLDSGAPPERMAHILDDIGAEVGLTERDVHQSLPQHVNWLCLGDPALESETAPLSLTPILDLERVAPLRIDNPAYVIYTSGSTGTPKGVVVSHQGLANLATEERERYAVTPAARVLQVASPTFDASVLELLLAHASGAALVVSPPLVFAADQLTDLLREQRITHAFVTPGVLKSMDPTSLDDLRVLITGGDRCPPELIEGWSAGRTFHNGYGPTEATVLATAATLDSNHAVTIGGPSRGMDAVILDTRLHPVPIGVEGELYLAGIQLARGYHNRTPLT